MVPRMPTRAMKLPKAIFWIEEESMPAELKGGVALLRSVGLGGAPRDMVDTAGKSIRFR